MVATNLTELSDDLSVENVISLRQLEGDLDLQRARLKLQGQIAFPFVWAFIALNVFVITGIAFIWHSEWQLIAAGKPIERLVTPEVVMSIIGGTTVQMGAAVLALTKNIFRDSESAD